MANNKYPLGWHKTCLANQMSSLAKQELALKNLQAQVARSQAEVYKYQLAIQYAENHCLSEFDREKIQKKVVL